MVSKEEATLNLDEKFVRKLADLMEETNLTEIEIRQDKHSIRVSRLSRVLVNEKAAEEEVAQGDFLTNLSSEKNKKDRRDNTNTDSISQNVPKQSEDTIIVNSPMVGAVYTRPEPSTKNFISVGDKVAKGDTLLLIEAMKVFNPIIAPSKGVILEILVSDETPVEFGEPLVVIKKN